jgi:hypothetical protein
MTRSLQKTGILSSTLCLAMFTALAALALGCRAIPAAGAQRSPSAGRVELVKAPDGGVQPQAAVDTRGVAHLVYLKGPPQAGDVFYVRREPGKEDWSAPLRVNSQPGSAIAVGTIRGAQLAVGKNGRVHVAWNGSGQSLPRGPGNSSPMLYSRLNDGGPRGHPAFEPQRNLMQFTTALDGGGTVAADNLGNVIVAWHGSDGSQRGEENRRLWVARSTDEGRTFSREAPAFEEATGACACCGTKAFADSKGAVYILYRAAAAKINRDIYLVVSRDQGKSYRGTSIHPWKVDS